MRLDGLNGKGGLIFLSCEFCIKPSNLDNKWKYCPVCGKNLKIIRTFHKINTLLFLNLIQDSDNTVMDENGELLEFERIPWNSEFDLITFEPDKVDISKELQWLKLYSDVQKIINP